MPKKLHYIFVKTFIPLMVVVVANILKYILNAFLANHFSASLYGDFAVAIRILSVVSFVLLFGTSSTSLRYLSIYLQNHDNDSALQYASWNMRFIIKSFLICIILSSACILGGFLLHINGIKHFASYHLAVYLIWLAPIVSIITLLSSYLLSDRKLYAAILLKKFCKYGLQLVFFSVAILLLNISYNSFSVVITLLGSYILLLLISIILTYVYMPFVRLLQFKNIFHYVSSNRSSAWFSTSLKMLFNSLVFMFICSLDLFIVETVLPQEHAVGHYAAILIITGFLYIVPNGVFSYIKPEISRLVSGDANRGRFQRQWNMTVGVSTFMQVVLLCIILFFGKVLLSHFGTSYSYDYVPLCAAALSVFVITVTMPAVYILNFSDGIRALLYCDILTVILQIIFGVGMTYYFGILGTSISVGISNLPKIIFIVIKARQNSGIKSLIIF